MENAKLKRLLADAMLDVSTLKELLGKTSEAQDPERNGGLGDEEKGALAAAGLRSGGGGSAGLPVSVDAAGRRGDTAEAAGVRSGTPSVLGIGASTFCFCGMAGC